MGGINKYLKIAKDTVIEPEDSIEDKVMDRISRLKQEDKDKFLDKNFIEFLKKSNSKPYQFEQKLKSRPGLFAFISILVIGVITILAYVAKLILTEENR